MPKEVPKSKVEGKKENQSPVFKFEDSGSAEEYLDWKKTVPLEFRRIVEAAIKSIEIRPSSLGLPLADQFIDKFSESLKLKQLSDAEGTDQRIVNLLKPLMKIGTQAGYINVFEILANPSVSWALKKRIYELQVRSSLEWLINQDLEEAAEKFENKLESENQNKDSKDELPPDSEEVRSSMEAGMEKGEGEPNPQFRVKPFYGGYYRQLAFNRLSPANLKWGKEESEFSFAIQESIDLVGVRIMTGKIKGGKPLVIPLPYDWAIDLENIITDAPRDSVGILRNQHGSWYIKINTAGVFSYQIRVGRRQTLEETTYFPEAEIEGDLSADLLDEIQKLKKSRLPKIKLKREVVKLIRNYLEYSADGAINKQLWSEYTSLPGEFFKKVWQSGKVDCFVANTLAMRALAEIDKNQRFISGYSVQGANPQGEAILHSGNGHAWIEILDHLSQRLIRLDATPKGDPNIDQEQQEGDLEGDYGENEEELASEEEVQKQIKEFKKKESQGVGQRKKPGYDLAEEQFSGLAECTPAQAREFLKLWKGPGKLKTKKVTLSVI